jgi:imidazolonepropionase-like amidohydrolase
MAYRIRGTVLPDGEVREVFARDGRFTFEPVEGAETLLEDVALLPGLVDMHAHLALASPLGDGTTREQAEASARAHLDAGVLLVREPGDPDHASTGLGPSIGLPRVIAAGRFLAPPEMYFPGLAREVSEDELPDAAAEELAAGSGWAKVIGDSPLVGGLARTFSRDALSAAADRIHALGGRIAIHAMDPDVIQDAIEAGFDSIEHGTGFRPDQMAEATRRGVAWVPTRDIEEGVRSMMPSLGFSASEIARVEGHFDGQPAALLAAADAGVTILAGTDAGMVPHGIVSNEVRLLLEAGLPPSIAIGAASWTARSFLGLPGIEEGAPADLVAFRDDPLEDPSVLAAPVIALLDGVLVRDAR